ncbi:hypothetical protein BV898_12626 [Hypsibius exemplaris]|uniref:GRAM domain-containing protein n=1 Tax=Hypsibius exemplaris TaxID=2072580 RepID=A0A1W0WCY5_HYPEX|nr:hypothetical protein BV898_12626 [Hypsibius exemplaris]
MTEGKMTESKMTESKMTEIAEESEEPPLPPLHLQRQHSVPVRELKFRSRFPEIPRYEVLLKYIPCIWRKDNKRSLRGGLYLSDNHIAFYCASKTAKATEQQRKLLFDIVTVVSVTKERSLSIFPDSIGLETSTGEKYIFGQLFSRNNVYKSLCDLCGVLASSRRSSVDPTVFLGGADAGFEDADDDDDDLDSTAASFQKRRLQQPRAGSSASKEHSSASSLSSSTSSSTTPSDLKRTLSVVREVSHDEYHTGDLHSAASLKRHQQQQQQSHSGVNFNLPMSTRSSAHHNGNHGHYSRGDMSVVDLASRQTGADDDQGVGPTSAFDQHLMTLLRLIIGILLLTALSAVYQIATRSADIQNPTSSLDQSLTEFRLASQGVLQVAEQARTFLNSFIKQDLSVNTSGI